MAFDYGATVKNLTLTLWPKLFVWSQYTGCPKINVLIERNHNQIECCGAKLYHGHDLGAHDPA